MTPAPTPCFDLKWRVSGDECTNGFQITSNDTGDSMYETLQECCEDYFGVGFKCKYDDICFDEDETPEPTLQPTGGSTPTVSKETTGPPTMVAKRLPHGHVQQ